MEQQAKSDTAVLNNDDSLLELIETLEEIDENKATAKLNAISMIDNKGRRIYY